MQNHYDFSAIIVLNNLIIGVLMMFASGSMAALAGRVSATYRLGIIRYARLSIFTVGTVWTVISGFVYLAFHVFRFGMDL
jgi:hypothetical protein